MSQEEPLARLAQLVQEPSFLPPRKDVPALFEVLLSSASDRSVFRGCVRCLLAHPQAAWEVGSMLCRTRVGEEKVVLLEVIGEIGSRFELSSKDVFLEHLTDLSPRVVRTALRALGNRTDVIEDDLLPWLEKPLALPERKALIEALGKIGGSRALQKLEGCVGTERNAEFERVKKQACTRIQRQLAREQGDQQISMTAPFSEATRWFLSCRRGLEPLLEKEVLAHHRGLTVQKVVDAGMLVFGMSSLQTLMQIRLCMECGLYVQTKEPTSVLHAVGIAMRQRSVTDTLCSLSEGPIRYRVHMASGDRCSAGELARLSDALSKISQRFVNDPHQSMWEIHFRREPEGIAVIFRPKVFNQNRFWYRSHDVVPASSHPTIAAALAFVAKPDPYHVIWDPFVGSGTELIELSFRAPGICCIGTDIDPQAVESARAQLTRARVIGMILCEDALSYAPKRLTHIVTNPPMGRRVARGKAKELLDAFLRHASHALSTGAVLTWVSPFPVWHRSLAQSLGFSLDVAYMIDMGGFDAELQRFVKN